jgi:branched-subunit amino acid transport protein
MRRDIILTVFGMAAVTFLPRFLPMAFLARRPLPETMKRALDYMPTAILSAIVFPILFSDGGGGSGIHLPSLAAGIPVFIFAWRWRSLWGSVFLGMLAYWACNAFFPGW